MIKEIVIKGKDSRIVFYHNSTYIMCQYQWKINGYGNTFAIPFHKMTIKGITDWILVQKQCGVRNKYSAKEMLSQERASEDLLLTFKNNHDLIETIIFHNS